MGSPGQRYDEAFVEGLSLYLWTSSTEKYSISPVWLALLSWNFRGVVARSLGHCMYHHPLVLLMQNSSRAELSFVYDTEESLKAHHPLFSGAFSSGSPSRSRRFLNPHHLHPVADLNPGNPFE